MSIRDLLNGCWKHYKYSSKALRELRELAEAMEIKVGKPTKASGTRWVPYLLRALAVLLQKNLPAIVSHFEHTAEARDASAEMQGRGRNLARKLKAYKFQLHLHLMWDILEEISRISLDTTLKPITSICCKRWQGWFCAHYFKFQNQLSWFALALLNFHLASSQFCKSIFCIAKGTKQTRPEHFKITVTMPHGRYIHAVIFIIF